ncbi:peptidoglycan DD-metalloendopeptidase family protein [Pelagibaculum spongiae]|nr:peptidoglycan DD-metalloendopeptidase family protein [Pelagibaculum spongiae]
MRADYKITSIKKRPVKHAANSKPRKFLGILLAGSFAVATASTLVMAARGAPEIDCANQCNSVRLPLALPELTFSEAPTIDATAQKNHQVKVRSGDSLARIFSRIGQSAADLQKIARLKQAKSLTRIKPGQTLNYQTDSNGRIHQLSYSPSPTESLTVSRQGNQFKVSQLQKDYEIRHQLASGNIRFSLYVDAIKAGLPENLVMELAGIFGWDIDFGLDIRSGDSFSILYEDRYLDGERVDSGRILAAEFVNQGEKFQAILAEDGKYYSAAGNSMRKAFLRAPVNFKYISSSFNPRRLHPVTGKVRPHRGIDYAARIGTPIVAAGDGKVIKSSYNRLNGNYVFIRHGSKYTTKYLHMNKRKVRTGQSIRQGQLIGTVGRTGRVTGPHLHYEFLVNGSHRNPRTVKLPDSKPIKKSQRTAFAQLTKKMLKRLDSYGELMLAMRSDNQNQQSSL